MIMKKPNLITLAFFLIALSFFAIQIVMATANDNVSGWAWSGNIGWISFNCIDFLPSGCTKDYGVSFSTSTIPYVATSSYAWSENIGWISFDPAVKSIPPAGPPAGGYDYTGSGYLAKLDTSIATAPPELRGWARACGKPDGAITCGGDGWDGWINLASDPGAAKQFSVKLDKTLKSGYHEFYDWAWGSDVVGWISFNCSSTQEGCGGSNYSVKTTFNPPPSANTLQITLPDYCFSISPTFSWNFTDPFDDNPFAYQVQIASDADFNNIVIDEGYQPSSSESYTPSAQLIGTNLQDGTRYYWRLQVWDPQGAASGWISPVPPDDSFTTPPHAYPLVNFTPSNNKPSVNEIVTFIDSSICYNGGSYPCQSQSATTSYAWAFPGAVPPSSNFKGNATTTYPLIGVKTAQLRITDNTLIPSVTCSATSTINVTFPMPDWREISPFSWIRNLSLAISNFVKFSFNLAFRPLAAIYWRGFGH